ncbi:MAG: hypothetical protein J6X58_02790 [Bacteroidales bacterium]|nr:hypothetical protein [Bacteroidales bacterium]
MVAKTIESDLRKYFFIPDDVPMKWGVIVESLGADWQARPAMLVGVDKLALDIYHRRFYSESSVLSVKREIFPANAIVEDDKEATVTIHTDGEYSSSVSVDDIRDVYLYAIFSRELILRAEQESII